MSDGHNHNRPTGDDAELGAALGKAIGRQADTPVAPPSVADIAARAAARARARRVRQGVIGTAATAALIAGGLVAWTALSNDGENSSVQVATRTTVSEDPAPPARDATVAPPVAGPPAGTGEVAGDAGSSGAAPAEGGPTGPEAPPATEPGTGTALDPADTASRPAPEDLSTGPTLEWIEVSGDINADLAEPGEMFSLGDGRIGTRDHRSGGERILITGDGLTWSTVELPEGISVHDIEVDGDYWVIAGQDPNDADHPGHVIVSDDDGSTWSETILELEPSEGLPRHCTEFRAVQDVMISGDRVVALVASHRFLDTPALLVEQGLIDEGTMAHEFRRSEDTLIFRLGHPNEWDMDDEGDLLRVDLEDLGLSSEQLRECDDLSSGFVRVFTGYVSGLEEVAEFQGWATSGIATRDGFAFGLRTAAESAWVTSVDGRAWSRTQAPDGVAGSVARGPDGGLWTVGDHTGLRIRRGYVNSAPETVATFEQLQPVGVLAAGPAGIATAAWALPLEIWNFLTPNFTKDGYELRLGAPDGGASLWNLADGTAVYEFTAEEMEAADGAPDGVREVVEDDGSTTVVFSDPDTGEDLVAFTEEDLTPDSDELVATRLDVFGPTGLPPTWIGWSADGGGWGWQDATEAFGLSDDEGISPVDLAVGDDFVLARFVTYDLDEVLRDDAAADPNPPASLRTRWFMASTP